MSLRKFLAPNLAALIFLSLIWIAGIDQVYVENDHQQNLSKYLQVQQRIVDNYVGETDINELFENSIYGFVEALNGDNGELVEVDISGTPADTVFTDLDLKNFREAFSRFEEAYLFIANNYPERNMQRLTEGAVQGMFNSLDPHSVYIKREDSERIQEDFEGKFQGIGIQFNIIDDTITVITAISGGPSDHLGIMSGDRIVAIDDSSAIGFTNDDVIGKLRGEKGTEVQVTIKRPRTSNPLNFMIERDDIPLTTLDTHYMLDDRSGYIKINRFAATTHDEFMAAVEDLLNQGMDRIVVDFRNNPGGYLSQAIAIAEEFFPRGTKLVSTKSRHSRFTSDVYSRKNGILRDLPVIALVNEGSASASEIVSGAIQDHDRGLIVGRRTFGKGLVQQQYELIDESNIRVTISQYHTPSGRLIQKPFEAGREQYAYEIYNRDKAVDDVENFVDHVPDSLVYNTDAGRKVYGGGGIVPDFIVQEDTTLALHVFNFMLANNIHFDFVRNFLDEEGEGFRQKWEDSFPQYRSDFKWSEENQEQFVGMLLDQGMILSDNAEPSIEDDTLTVSREHLDDVIWMVEGRIKAEIARQVWGLEYFFPVINDYFNDILTEATNLWDEVSQLESLASSSHSDQPVRRQ
ncbi:MAG: S41 family peptidase [Balneolaceae bacterium]